MENIPSDAEYFAFKWILEPHCKWNPKTRRLIIYSEVFAYAKEKQIDELKFRQLVNRYLKEEGFNYRKW